MKKEILLYRFRPMYSLLEKYKELENEEIYFSSVEDIGFQDSCDGSFVVSMLNFRAIEAYL